MQGKTRIATLGAGFMIAILPAAIQAQGRHRIQAPQSLLQVLDEEDRSCVIQNGGLSKAVSVQPIQLAADRSQQILVRGSGLCLCGAQNCKFWIYRKSADTYDLLLKGIASTKVRPARRSTKGYRDVVGESHASASETLIRTYRFDGANYQLQRCVNRAYYDVNGNQTKKPTFTPCQ
jgi:hypothetical protein